ncbi:Asp-tRNA(Asn)/Glu-tRNA(Gln) amidotransferase GatCAB subunit A, partial [Myxococcota bacterium]|nr:Asp-tRNA(Asn)/Glu-tRNA(Gln) amidotransferase GatCAB subunit A [Myxococcota bacterium]
MTELYSETIHSLSRQLKDGTISSVEITQSCLDRAEKTSDYGAWLTLDTEGALAQAKESDKRRASEQNIGPFDGIPVALKDNFLSEGLPTRAASKILETFVSPYDGTAVRKLKEAGSVILGKANMDEFAMG